jgi:hypothetical protein
MADRELPGCAFHQLFATQNIDRPLYGAGKKGEGKFPGRNPLVKQYPASMPRFMAQNGCQATLFQQDGATAWL